MNLVKRWFSPGCHRAGRLIVGIFFSALVLLGLALHRDYGISWDEPDSRTLGIVNAMYLGKVLGIDAINQSEEFSQYRKFPLETYKDRDYGVAFELPAILLERLLKLRDEQQIYFFRHLLTYLVCVGGMYGLYCLAKRRFHDWRIGLLAVTFFMLSPRMFAESFYNDKDLVFLAIFTIGLNASIAFVLKPTWLLALLSGLACALAINIRLIGILLPMIVLGVFLVQAWQERLHILRKATLAFWFMLATFGFTVIFWPWLWSDPFGHLAIAFANMRQFRWFGFPFYLGQYYPVKELPWHYLLVSIFITTPLWIVVLWFVGALQTLWQWFTRHGQLWKSNEQMQDMIFLAIAVGPIAAIILMHSVVYNGWRHIYFIYPAMILLAIKACVEVWNYCSPQNLPILNNLARKGSLVVLAISMAFTAHWMYVAHPMQNVYFNWLAGKNWTGRWEVDYWGLSNRQALQYIANIDERQLIRIWPGSNTPLYYALKVLPEKDRNRLAITSFEDEADYVVTNYHGNNADYQLEKNYRLIKDWLIQDELIYSIYTRN